VSLPGSGPACKNHVFSERRSVSFARRRVSVLTCKALRPTTHRSPMPDKRGVYHGSGGSNLDQVRQALLEFLLS
jgi:hypothetical protein